MIDLDEFARLKKEADKWQREADRAEGVLRQLKATLKSEFGCSTVKEGDALLAKMTAEAEEAEAEFRPAFEAYKEKYRERLA